jgi:hypothetical protein
MLQLRAIWRSSSFNPNFNLSISLIWRMLVLLAGIVSLQKVEELTLPADISLASAPIHFYSGRCCPPFRDVVQHSGIAEKMDNINWNQRTTSPGIGGQHRME